MIPPAISSTMSYDSRNSTFKRQRHNQLSNVSASADALNENDIEEEDELWAEYSLFGLDATLFPEETQPFHNTSIGLPRPAKRACEFFAAV